MREKVLEAAIHEFTKSGFHFTMNDVAKSLGMSKKTIYTVFDTKEALLEGIADKYFRDFQVMKQTVSENPDMDVVMKIENILCALPERYHNIGLSNLYELRDKYPKLYKRLHGYMQEGWNLVEEYMYQGISDGIFEEISVPVFMTMVEGTVSQFLKNKVLVNHQISYENAKKEMVKILLDGARKKMS